MKFQRTLLLYKQSVYETYFADAGGMHGKRGVSKQFERFRRTHRKHYETLAKIEEALKQNGLSYQKFARGRKIDYARCDLVITVGGDGTFLEAARHLKKQLILGINSDPEWSVGRFCQASGEDFPRVLKRILQNKFKVKPINRFQLQIEGRPKVRVLNDVLAAHYNPAAMSHYALEVNGVREEQRSSGIWIATAAGSSGAIKSAGGRLLPYESKAVQYRPRELHQRPRHPAKLKGGVVFLKKPIVIRSLMEGGFVYVDGAHLSIALPFGSCARITSSSHPLKLISF
jgi:NAD+ kinase